MAQAKQSGKGRMVKRGHIRLGRKENRVGRSGLDYLIQALVRFCDQKATGNEEFRGVPEKDGSRSKDTKVELKSDTFHIHRANVTIVLSPAEARHLLVFLEEHGRCKRKDTTKLDADGILRVKFQKKMVEIIRYELVPVTPAVQQTQKPAPPKRAEPAPRRRRRLGLGAPAAPAQLVEIDLIPGRGVSRGPQRIDPNEMEDEVIVLHPSPDQLERWADDIVRWLLDPRLARRGIKLDKGMIRGVAGVFPGRGGPGPLIAKGTTTRMNWVPINREMHRQFVGKHPLADMMTHTGGEKDGGFVFTPFIPAHRVGGDTYVLPLTLAAERAGLMSVIDRIWQQRTSVRARRRSAEGPRARP